MTLPESSHYDWQQLQDGILAAVMRPDGNSRAESNSGIVDLGDQTLVFDSSNTPMAARDLLAASLAFTGREPAFVINSHWHGDHVRGNQVYSPNTHIISSNKTAELISTRGQAQLQFQRDNLPRLFAEHEAKLAATTNEHEKVQIAQTLAFYRSTLEALPELDLRLPNITFESKMSFIGSQRRAELICDGGGHSPSDAYLYLPDSSVVFIADLMFVGFHAFISDGDPDETIRLLDDVKRLKVDQIVPGHGPVGTTADLDFMQHYLRTLQSIVAEIKAQGGTADTAANHPIPDEFSHLVNLAGMYQDSMHFLFERPSA
jgi:glyoxylase-like metal-dependent hydrolase (beta-lactamase superfamily II)